MLKVGFGRPVHLSVSLHKVDKQNCAQQERTPVINDNRKRFAKHSHERERRLINFQYSSKQYCFKVIANYRLYNTQSSQSKAIPASRYLLAFVFAVLRDRDSDREAKVLVSNVRRVSRLFNASKVLVYIEPIREHKSFLCSLRTFVGCKLVHCAFKGLLWYCQFLAGWELDLRLLAFSIEAC